jgi:hypothetical protein
MEDISRKKLVAAGVIVGVILAATGLSETGTDRNVTGALQVQDQQQAIDTWIDQPPRARDEDMSQSASPSKQDDDVDIALGGSWDSSNCTFVPVQVVKASTGELVEAIDCRRSSPKPVHAYEAYASEALESLAYADPIAALVLGRRLAANEPEKAWDLMIRASALLGGDSRPIKWLATNSFNRVTSEGEMVTETIQLRYVLDTLAKRLENRSEQSFDFREHFLRSSLSSTDFSRMDGMVDSLLEKMKAIEEETTGNSTIGGAG